MSSYTVRVAGISIFASLVLLAVPVTVFAANDGSGTMTVTPTTATAHEGSLAPVFTFTNNTGSAFASGSEITFTIPAGWTAPVSDLSVTDVGGSGCSPQTPTVSGSGPWTVTVHQTCAAGQSFTVTYGGVGGAAFDIASPGTGTYTFTTKSQDGTSGLADITTTQPTITVSKNDVSVVVNIPTPSSVTVGQSYSISAQVTKQNDIIVDPTGTVTFSDGTGGTCTTSGAFTDVNGNTFDTPSCSITSSSAGSGTFSNKTITGTYNGDANYNTGSGTQVEQVTPETDTITITNAASLASTPTVTGQSYTVDVSVARSKSAGQPGGSMTISDGTDSCTDNTAGGSGGTATFSCNLTSSTAGAKTIKATYSGDANFFSGNTTASHTVNKDNTLTFIANANSLNTHTTVGASYSVQWNVDASFPGGGTPTGTVTVSEYGTAMCSGSVGAGGCQVPAPIATTTSLVVTYGGDSNYNGSASAAHSHTVVATNLSITADATSTVFGAPIPNFTFTATGFVNGDTAAAFTTQPTCGVSGTPTDPGNYIITCSGAVDANYNFAYHTGTYTILKADQAIDITEAAPSNATYSNTFNVAATGGASGDPVVIGATGSCTTDGNNPALITMTSGTGTCNLSYNQAGNTDYNAAPVQTSTTVAEKLALTVTGITASDRGYNGTLTTPIDTTSAALVGVLPGDMGNVSLDATLAAGSFATKDVGVNKIVTISNLQLTGSAASNYTITDPTTIATVSAQQMTVTAVTDSKTYDGTTDSSGVPMVTNGVVETAAGDSAVLSQTFDTKDVGTGKSLIPSIVITDGAGGADYDVTYVNDTTGSISQKDLTVDATGVDKVYDGTDDASTTQLSSTDVIGGDDVTISGTSLFEETNVDTNIVVDVTGITLGGADAGNYDLQNTTATTQADITQRPITVTADDVSKQVPSDPDPAFTFEITTGSFATTDSTSTVFSGAPTSNSTNIANTTYDVTQGTLAANSNYDMTFVPGTFIIGDTIPPVISSQIDITTEATGPSGAVVTYGPITATDNVDGTDPVNCAPVSGSTFPITTTTVTCTSQDMAGNMATETFNVTVQDTTPPTITIPGQNPLALNDGDTFTDPIASVTATDIVDGTDPVTEQSNNVNMSHSGSYSVVYTATDTHGNTATATLAVNVSDMTAPVITVPGNMTAEATGPSGAVVTFTAPTATDNQDGTDPVICSNNSGDTFPIGITTVDCSSTDSSNNIGTNSFTVTVQDTTAPVVSSVVVTTNPIVQSNVASTTVTFTATDAVGVNATDVTLTDGTNTIMPATVTNDGSGNYTATFDASALLDGTVTASVSASDAATNQSTVMTATATKEATPPTITLNGASTINLTVGATYTEQGATATDPIDGTDAVTIGGDTVDTSTPGIYNVTYDAVDSVGNHATQVVRTVNVSAPAPSGGGGGGGGGGGNGPIVVTYSQYDLNHDGNIDILDFNILMTNFGKTGTNIPGDFNGDGVVNLTDFNNFMVHWTS